MIFATTRASLIDLGFRKNRLVARILAAFEIFDSGSVSRKRPFGGRSRLLRAVSFATRGHAE
jgi:hypothetical protein